MMARWVDFCLHVGLFLIRTTVISADSGCSLRRTSYDKRGFVADIGSDYAALLESQSVVSLFECVRYVERRRTFQWFIYNPVDNLCISSTCWAMPIQFVGVSNNILYRKGELTIPQSCSDVKKTDPTATDGEYWIYPDAPTFLGCPTKIYCHDMASGSPREYVSLTVTNTGEYPGVQDLICKDIENTITGRVTNFSKIRVDVKVMEVNKTDHTFATGTGAYGEAEDCYSQANRGCGPKGNFQVDTNGTGMLVDPEQTWNGFGYKPHTPSVMRSADGVQIDLLCGGGCGGCRPVGPLKLHKNFQEVIPQENAASVTKG
ncbi:A disintegrin and metalloproteinase with thrombospondin motifs 9-like [Haliotis rufescens]|uniref:A disintegrin and metalloproteinase with thrombospondin motifs 9-like n=1 Tax=Haliotis rufescens TaxID=6454 RepID=UPI00201F37CE|nr:A disintegrin and metalloproteinase with thrombospondin motifs 9-like [Haliotis rufescens]